MYTLADKDSENGCNENGIGDNKEGDVRNRGFMYSLEEIGCLVDSRTYPQVRIS